MQVVSGESGGEKENTEDDGGSVDHPPVFGGRHNDAEVERVSWATATARVATWARGRGRGRGRGLVVRARVIGLGSANPGLGLANPDPISLTRWRGSRPSCCAPSASASRRSRGS